MTRLRFLGTGTSQGVPIIACQCPVCKSQDPRDKRFRSSAFVEYEGMNILIDAGPDFRSQMLQADIRHLDAILLTHNHKDHTGGLDDVRSFNYIDRKAAEIYCEERVLRSLKNDYAYAFEEEKYPGAPEWHVHLIDERPFRVDSLEHSGELVWVHDKGYFYRQPDGRVINADINGSLNIGCKYDSRIFPEGKDYSYLYGTVKSMTYSRILGESRRRNDFLMWHTTIKAVPVKRDSGRSVRPVSAKAARSPRLLAYAKAVG